MPRLKTLSLYMLKELVPPFLIGICIFVFILMTTQLLKINELIIVHGVSFREAGLLIFYLLSTFISISIPLAILFSVVFVFGRFSSDGELLAMRASGISHIQLLPPFMIAALFLSIAVVLLSLFVEPYGFREFRTLAKRIGSDVSTAMISPRVFNEKFFGLMVYADEVNPKTKELTGVFLNDERMAEEPLTVVAKSGKLIPHDDDRFITFRLRDGSIHYSTDWEKKEYQRIDFKSYDINMDLESMIKLPKVKPRMLTYPELRAKLKSLDPGTKDYRKHLVELHRKFALSASCFVFIILGVAIGGRSQRTFKSMAFLATLLFMLLYWVLYLKMGSLAEHGVLPVWCAMWVPNILILFIGSYVLWRNSQK